MKKAYEENDLRASHGLLDGLLVSHVGLNDFGALLDELLGGGRVGVARNGTGLEGTISKESADDGGAWNEVNKGRRCRKSGSEYLPCFPVAPKTVAMRDIVACC